MLLEYKKFGSERLEEIKEIYKEQGWTAYLKDDEKLKRAYDNSLYVYGIFDADKLIGFIRCVGDGEHIVLIEDLIIKAAYQRQGLGTALLNHIFETYADVRMVSLYTDSVDIKANSFYRKMGMQLAEEKSMVSYVR